MTNTQNQKGNDLTIKMEKFEIIHYENDGMNNTYKHEVGIEFKNLDEASKYLRNEFLSIPKDEEIIYEDGDENEYSITFNMFSEKELLESNPEIKSIDELDDIPTETWTIRRMEVVEN